MLLAIDVGNSNTVFGLYRQAEAPAGTAGAPAATAERPVPELLAHWRITTPASRTTDEFGILLRSLFQLDSLAMDAVTGIAIASVVPPMDATLRRVCEQYFNQRPVFIEPGVKTGMPVLTDNPAEVGADRIVNCVAAYERFHGPAVVVDLGTATTFDVVSAKGEFLGGAIAPGLGIAADALFNSAARLPRVEIKRPAKVIGTGTVDNIQIGLYYGYIGLIDGILERMLAELPPETKTIATGGMAGLVCSGSRLLGEVDELLTLTGLRLVHERHMERQEKLRRRGH